MGDVVAVTASIRQIVKDIIGGDADAQQPLMDAGLDSLGAPDPSRPLLCTRNIRRLNRLRRDYNVPQAQWNSAMRSPPHSQWSCHPQSPSTTQQSPLWRPSSPARLPHQQRSSLRRQASNQGILP